MTFPTNTEANLPMISGRPTFSVFPADYSRNDCVRGFLNMADAMLSAADVAEASGSALVRSEIDGQSFAVTFRGWIA